MRKSIIALTPLMIAPLCWAQEKPNVVIFLVDDMGYSDIGCYGGEIMTPNLDKLASTGVRFTQFYNTSRSCPARASLMTGLYQHQAGIGQMSEDPGTFKKETQRDINDWGSEGYQGYLNRNCVTIAEVLKENGYHTYMAGKWHLGMHGQEKWPLQRGFERFYGILAGAASYLRPEGGRGLTLDNEHLPAPESPYYTTDAFTDHALQFVGEQKDDKPFFWLSMLRIGPCRQKRKTFRSLPNFTVPRVGIRYARSVTTGCRRWVLSIRMLVSPNGKTVPGMN